ncbi:MAG TPA: hypothetical protein IAB40_02655 [Candidatus Onthocola stercoravium]|nr:hypothetical protein [Candidatus Onthocola stercoravium]
MKNKILIFSHLSDIDGMGGVVLAKLAFGDVDFVLCETFNLLDKIKEKIADQSIYEYDQIFITDMWLEDPEVIWQDPKLKDKVLVFDHHESSLAILENKTYDFITIRIKDELGRCSGTSLFYQYLVNNNLLQPHASINTFVELTRLYDTWEWVTVKNEPMARNLTTLFNAVGANVYIDLMFDKLDVRPNEFTFSDLELSLINNKNKQIKDKLQSYAKNIIYRNVLGLKAGIVFIDYEYRNDFAQYLRDNQFPMDFVMMISMDNGTISYRYVTAGIKVLPIAEHFGGKGHDYAASSPISHETKEDIIDIICKRKRTKK